MDVGWKHRKMRAFVSFSNRIQCLRAPLAETVRDQGRRLRSLDHPFYFPGHKRGVGAPELLRTIVGEDALLHDLPELPELDNLFCPEGVIKDAQDMASLAFGSRRTYFLVNGTTCGIQAAVLALCQPGSTLVLPRNCHQAAFSAMVLAGTNPQYIEPEFCEEFSITLGVTAQAVNDGIRAAIRRDGRLPAAVLLTSPTYHGACLDLPSISQVCVDYDIPLIVDEAHGAHFGFHPVFPPTALASGADIAVQSTHKVLTSLTQSSMLHVGTKRVDQDKLSLALQTLQSSSPSYLLLSSLDASRQQLQEQGTVLLEKSLELAQQACRRIKTIPAINLLTMDAMGASSVAALDPLRITVSLNALNVDGFTADDFLRANFQVTCELPLASSLTFAIGLGTTLNDIDALVHGIETVAERFARRDDRQLQSAPTMRSLTKSWGMARLSPREAFFAARVQTSLEDAVGRVSAEMLCPYPPGIPVIVPGEEITQDAIEHLLQVVAAGGSVSGASDPSLNALQVLQ